MEYELYHYGIKGMKWGVRRYQNKDGTLTAAGKKRISESGDFMNPGYARSGNKLVRDNKNAKNRWRVSDEYHKEMRSIPNSTDARTGKRGKLILDTIDKYADATVKDLKLKNTESTKQFVKDHLNDSLGSYHRAAIETYRQLEKRKSDTRSLDERINAVNNEYKTKIRDAERKGNDTLADRLQTEWANAVDNEYWYEENIK